jgi:hypothetical protein
MNRLNSTTLENKMNHCGHCLNAFPGDWREILCPKCNEAFQKYMTIEETKEAIKVMQAFVDGKKIRASSRLRPKPIWFDLEPTDKFVWDWNQCVYEIKPEPKEFWLVGGAAYKSQSEAIHSALSFKPAVKVIHVREVV